MRSFRVRALSLQRLIAFVSLGTDFRIYVGDRLMFSGRS